MLLNRTFLGAFLLGTASLIPFQAAFAQSAGDPEVYVDRPRTAITAPLAGTPGAAAPGERVRTNGVAPVIDTSPLGQALRRAGVTDPAVAVFYAARDNRPFWTGADHGWAEALLASLRHAPDQGLPENLLDPQGLSVALATGGPDAEARFMKAYLSFGRIVSSGLLNPEKVDDEIHFQPVRPVPARLLASLHAEGTAPASLDFLAPDLPEYRTLVQELARYRTLASEAVLGGTVPEGPTLRPGDRSPRVAALRDRLQALGDVGLAMPATAIMEQLTDAAATAPQPQQNRPIQAAAGSGPVPGVDRTYFDPELEAAVKRFQLRNGLIDDGAVGPQTLRTINTSAADRYNRILVNLERVRWLHRDMNERHIFVNQADFTMELIENNQVLLASRVVVGQTPKHRTPEFIEMMDHIVVNPTWHVPTSIATKEILPKLKQDPTYLARNGMRLVPTGADPVPDGVTSDYSLYSRGYFPFRVKQEPGDENSLGRVKFMFPNKYAIYLHDTPSKSLFNRDARAFSHGCVRVQRPFDLAYALLQGQVADPKASFDGWLDSGKERRVNLDRPVRMYLTYRTVWVDRQGEVQFRNDIYGRDARTIAALSAAGVETLD
ncbi:murein L,D-transpeptidase [Paroceanicella profunda]|uniref:Murein L,D-transpeptidase n=1 Tax=Paroceanicella profunda TaxID=2579971 RepID=A0A5B8G1G8_9RHOB|nr:L,D-transpeptidase family protein [Paroceanicella profunda]QDL92922.1 murein L,D-transpeptidase [Paroceanicella profunda]